MKLHCKNNKLHILMILFGLAALILISIPATKLGIMEAAVSIPLLWVLIIRKKPHIGHSDVSIKNILISICLLIYSGVYFCNRWGTHTAVRRIAESLHIPAMLLALIPCICLAVFALYVTPGLCRQLYRLLFAEKRGSKLSDGILICTLSACTITIIAQLAIELYAFSMGTVRFILGSIIPLALILLLSCIFRSIKISITVTSFLFLVISVANAYIYSFRFRLIEPTDIYSFGTAMDVADNYSPFPVPVGVWGAVAIWGVLIYVVFRFCSRTKPQFDLKRTLIIIPLCVAAVISTLLVGSGLKTYHYQNQGAGNYGYILDFTTKIKEFFVPEPSGYSKEIINGYEDKYAQTTESEEAKRPHIIVIMDEAYSDLSVYGEIATNETVAPFISSLRENTVYGYAMASVYGGNTANSEFEFLTGNTMAWLSPNSVPYQQYTNNKTYSMVSYLKEYYGYNCIAMHPYNANNWNRPAAYEHLGFDTVLFKEDFPQSDFVRNYISDREMFEKIIEVYENNRNEPTFLFGVSMQNHGNYAYSGDNFTPSVSLEGYKGSYPIEEQYLSLIQETDKAVELLINYFSEAEDDVVILFFGDHQPILSESFYSSVSNVKGDDIEKQQLKYKVPFFVWANYDIEEKQIECTSLNYLSSYAYEAASIPLPPYNRFLSDMEGSIPWINAYGFYSTDKGSFVEFEDANEKEQYWLDAYKQLQYNNMFDKSNKSEKLFPTLK